MSEKKAHRCSCRKDKQQERFIPHGNMLLNASKVYSIHGKAPKLTKLFSCELIHKLFKKMATSIRTNETPYDRQWGSLYYLLCLLLLLAPLLWLMFNFSIDIYVLCKCETSIPSNS